MTTAEFRKSMTARAADAAAQGAKVKRRMMVFAWLFVILAAWNACVIFAIGSVWNAIPGLMLCVNAVWYERMARKRLAGYLQVRQQILTIMEETCAAYFHRHIPLRLPKLK